MRNDTTTADSRRTPDLRRGEPARVHGRDGCRDAGGAGRARAAARARRAGGAGDHADRRRGDRALDGRRHGADRDVRPQALHAVRAGRARSSRCSARSRRSTPRSTTSSSRRGSSRSRSVIDRGTVIRTFNAADLGFILHSRHQYHWHTGYVPPQPMAMPHLGAVISQTLGPKNPDMPAFIAIGQTVEGAGEIGTLKAFHTAGFLGTEHGPFLIVDPQDAASAVRPPKELGDARFRSRRELFDEAAGAGAGVSIRQRLPARVAGAIARHRRPPAELAVGEGVRPVARAEGELRRLQHRPLRPGLPAGAAAGRGGRPLRRSHDRVHPVRLLGHATRTATSAPRR